MYCIHSIISISFIIYPDSLELESSNSQDHHSMNIQEILRKFGKIFICFKCILITFMTAQVPKSKFISWHRILYGHPSSTPSPPWPQHLCQPGSNNVDLDLDTSNKSVVQGSYTCPSLLTGGECDEGTLPIHLHMKIIHVAKLPKFFFDVIIGFLRRIRNINILTGNMYNILPLTHCDIWFFFPLAHLFSSSSSL